MLKVKEMGLNGARVYYDSCFEVESDLDDTRISLSDQNINQFFMDSKDDVVKQIKFCGNFIYGNSFSNIDWESDRTSTYQMESMFTMGNQALLT